MIAEPLVCIRCGVCGSEEHQTICAAVEVAAQMAYLRRFHRLRLRARCAEALTDRADFTQDYATDIVACVECGLVFRNPRPTPGAIARAYASDRYGHQRLEALWESQLELYRRKARRLRRRLPPGSRVVEVGSFVGGFLQAGAEQGWEMIGVDPGREVAAFCAQRGLPVFSGTLAGFAEQGRPGGWAPGTVDCVAIWNAFDQMPHPEPELKAAAALLRPGGILALRVPNGECFRWATGWVRRLSGPPAGWLRAAMAWNNLLAFPYLHGYSARSLDWMLAWHGLERLETRPGTLCRLADEQTEGWAAREERLLKALWRFAAVACAVPAPWLDLYFTLNAESSGAVAASRPLEGRPAPLFEKSQPGEFTLGVAPCYISIPFRPEQRRSRRSVSNEASKLAIS